MRVGAVVEGLGERKAVPSLVAKTAQIFDVHAFVVHIVECGNWGALKKPGGLEKYGRLLLAECECDKLIYVVDLDDGCPKEEFESVCVRLASLSALVQKPVTVVLMNREYETWFLQDLLGIKERSPEIEWVDGPVFEDATAIRDAKGTFGRHLRFSYRPSIDQEKFTKKLNLTDLLAASRSLRKLAAFLTGNSHQELCEII